MKPKTGRLHITVLDGESLSIGSDVTIRVAFRRTKDGKKTNRIAVAITAPTDLKVIRMGHAGGNEIQEQGYGNFKDDSQDMDCEDPTGFDPRNT